MDMTDASPAVKPPGKTQLKQTKMDSHGLLVESLVRQSEEDYKEETGHDAIIELDDDGNEVKREVSRSHKTGEDVQAITDKWIDAQEHGRMTYEEVSFWWTKKNPTNPTSTSAVGKYVKAYKDTGDYFVPKNGRPPLLLKEQSKMLEAVAGRLRQRGNAVCACLIRHAARGIMRRNKVTARQLQLGGKKCSMSWARSWLKAHGYLVRKATTDRTCAACEIEEAGKPFFEALKQIQLDHGVLDPELVYNMDEFMILMNRTSKWTWHRRVKGSKCVPIKQLKEGTTCSVLSG